PACACPRSSRRTSTFVARNARFITVRRSRVYPESGSLASSSRSRSNESPASTSAPRIMSPATPLGQSKYATFIAWSADLRGELVDLVRLGGGAVAVVDVDPRDAGRARAQHGEERGDAAE